MLRARFSDGTWLVELGELRDGSLLVEMVAAAVGLRDDARPLLDVLTSFVSARELLLVLDNCEHVVDAVATFTEQLLQTCPNLRILATSREPLRIGGESVLWLSPLGVPDVDALEMPDDLFGYDAVELFAIRAAATVPEFALTEQNKATVAGICSRLDGLPLAIELAAARLHAMSPEQLLQRFTDRQEPLGRGGRSAPRRQQTLQWSIGWSFDLCTAAEQHLWGRLTVFAGTFDFEAAEYVCGEGITPDEFADLVTSLVDKSIIIRTESGGVVRLRMLETLRAYGKETMARDGHYLDLRRRHRDWYEHVAVLAEREWFSARQTQWIVGIEQELPNLREALELSLSEGGGRALRTAAALLPFWTSRGMPSEGRRLLDRALADSPSAPADDHAKALYGAAALAVILGDLEAAQTRVRQAQALLPHLADPTTRVFISVAAGLTAQLANDPDHGRTTLRAAVDAGGDALAQASALLGLGWAHELGGDVTGALAWHEKSLSLSESHGELIFRTNALWSIGIAKWRLGKQDEAVQSLREGLRYARDINDRRAAAACIEALAWTTADTPRTAAVLLAAADNLRQSVGSILGSPSDLIVYHQECAQRVQAALGDDELDAARQEGASLRFDEAVAYALGN
jgi:non-specific serine/threonine protein kinase